jgi:prevent-host-death family protein
MKTVNIHEAKAQLSSLIERVLAGEEVVIARRNVPLVRLVSVASAQTSERLGWAEGMGELADDFDAPLDDFDGYQ